MRDLKTLLRYDKLVEVGTDLTNITPKDLLQHLPKVEPLAVGTVFEHYAPGDPDWEGHYKLKGKLTWQDFPTFNWCDIYCKLAWGLDPLGRATPRRPRTSGGARGSQRPSARSASRS